MGALDELGLIILPLLLGGGMQLTPFVSKNVGLQFDREHVLPSGAMEVAYRVT